MRVSIQSPGLPLCRAHNAPVNRVQHAPRGSVAADERDLDSSTGQGDRRSPPSSNRIGVKMEPLAPAHGALVLFGSGETGKHGRLIQEQLLSRYPKPVHIGIIETPAGFQPNVDWVTAKTRTFYERNLQNLKPEIIIVPARRRGSTADPDDPAVAKRLDRVDVVVSGAGSPTYAVRQLEGTLTLDAIRRRFQAGATIVLASAAAIASGTWTIPVYEIFKVGDDPVWKPGLDLTSELGLRLAVVPH